MNRWEISIITPRGFAPRTPPHARSRGPTRPAPLAWAHSRARYYSEGLRPSDSPTPSPAGPPHTPRAARVGSLARSFAAVVCGFETISREIQFTYLATGPHD